MDIFYGKAVNEKHLLLDEEELHHLRVMRKQVGDSLKVADGIGRFYLCEIASLKKNECLLDIKSVEEINPPKPRFHLVVAPTKNIDRIEWLVEKAVEAGISEISFVQCRRSERKDIRVDRILKVALSAMKQSQKAYLPIVNEMISFASLLDKTGSGQRFICMMEAPKENHIRSMLKAGADTTILIGPEGDFHEEETAAALKAGFQPLNLGPSRFRTETAALAACIWFNFANQ